MEKLNLVSKQVAILAQILIEKNITTREELNKEMQILNKETKICESGGIGRRARFRI